MPDDLKEDEFPEASILIVDDHRPNLLALEALLEPLEHRVVAAQSAQGALGLLAEQEFAVILCDVRMPGMDGFEMIARLRQEGLARQTPVMLLTALDLDRESARRAYELGAVDYITKPIDSDLLRWRVGALVSLYRRGAELKKRGAMIAQKVRETALAHQKADQSAALAQEAQRLVWSKDTFLGILGHDLRNPLSAMLLGSQKLAQAQDLSARDRETAARIVRAGERIQKMVDDILEFARTSSGVTFPSRLRMTNLQALIGTVLDELHEANPRGAIDLVTNIAPVAMCDPDRIAQALGNLVRNALQHGKGAVTISLRSDDDQVTICVHNLGTPIRPDAMGALFDPFRGNATDSIRLGLFIVKEILIAHGGTVSVRSSIEDGTTFEMSWPRWAGAPATEENRPQ